MKRWWKIVAGIDGVVLAAAFGCMAWINNRSDYGVSALQGAGQFALWYLVFQTALVLAVVLLVWALIAHICRKRK